MPLGLGALSAASRLNMVYLAHVDTVHDLLHEECQRAHTDFFAELKTRPSKSADIAWDIINQGEMRLAPIFAGKSKNYFAIDWFSGDQLGRYLAKHFGYAIGEETDLDNDVFSPEGMIFEGVRQFLYSFLEGVVRAINEGWPRDKYQEWCSDYVLRWTKIFLNLESDAASSTVRFP